jgi:hypothetical protein
VVLIVIILIFRALNEQSLIDAVYKAAGFTYGPLLGLFAFGIFTTRRLREGLVLPTCTAGVGLTLLIVTHSQEWLNGYKFGFEILLLNGALIYLGLLLISQPASRTEAAPILS